MARTYTINERTGERFPQKSDKKRKSAKATKKWFGFREGDGSKVNAIKGIDFMNYGYPQDLRCRSVKKQLIQDRITKQELVEAL